MLYVVVLTLLPGLGFVIALAAPVLLIPLGWVWCVFNGFMFLWFLRQKVEKQALFLSAFAVLSWLELTVGGWLVQVTRPPLTPYQLEFGTGGPTFIDFLPAVIFACLCAIGLLFVIVQLRKRSKR